MTNQFTPFKTSNSIKLPSKALDLLQEKSAHQNVLTSDYSCELMICCMFFLCLVALAFSSNFSCCARLATNFFAKSLHHLMIAFEPKLAGKKVTRNCM